jgi:hypothetical protein
MEKNEDNLAFMGKKELDLIDKAKEKHGVIYPCGRTSGWTDCFTLFKGKLHFWFNTDDHSTHVEIEEFVAGERTPLT